MSEFDTLFDRLKKVERSADAKEKTLRRFKKNRLRKRPPLYPAVVTGIVMIAALFFIMLNMEEEISPRAQGILVNQIDESFILSSMSADEFNPDQRIEEASNSALNSNLADHVGVFEINNRPWENILRKVLEGMSKTAIHPNEIALYDLGVMSGDKYYRFKVWNVNGEAIIKDFDSGLYYVNKSKEAKSFLEMAEQLLKELGKPIMDSIDEGEEKEEEEGKQEEKAEEPEEPEKEVQKEVPTLGLSKEQFQAFFNDERHQVSIKIGEVMESTDRQTLQYILYNEKNAGANWNNIEITAGNNPDENLLTNIVLYAEGPDYDLVNLFYLLDIIRGALDLSIDTADFMALTNLYTEEESLQVDEQFDLEGFIFTSKLSEEVMRFTIEPDESR